MSDNEMNNYKLNQWGILVDNIKLFYNKLIQAHKDNDVIAINYYQGTLLSTIGIEKKLLSELNINSENQEEIFSFILQVIDIHMNTRMYNEFEPIMIQNDVLKSDFSLRNILQFQKRKIENNKKREILSQLLLNKIYVLCNLANEYDFNIIIDKIYEISFTNPDIEQKILKNMIHNTFIDKKDPYYEEIKRHLKNKIISIILDNAANPSLSESTNIFDIADITTYLTYLYDYDLIKEIENKIEEIAPNNKVLKEAINKTKELLNINEIVRK